MALISVVVAAAAGSAQDSPHRKLGLWEQHLTVDDGSYVIPPSLMCLDAAAEARLTLVGSQMDRSRCTDYRLERVADGGWSFHSVCKLDARTMVTTSGSASGDFTTSYAVSATGVTSGAAASTHRVAIAARWLGPCPPGQTGGDVTTGGKTRNALTGADR